MGECERERRHTPDFERSSSAKGQRELSKGWVKGGRAKYDLGVSADGLTVNRRRGVVLIQFEFWVESDKAG